MPDGTMRSTNGSTRRGSWQPGSVVAGRYRLDSLVGAGAMGVVWRAADLRLDRVVAVKQLRVPAGSRDEIPRVRKQVFREARIAARLQHPLAVAVYDVTTDEHHQPLLIMEYVPSESLAQLLVDRGALAPEQVARIGADVATALTAAHAAGIVHRDIKPANILLPLDGEGRPTGRDGDVPPVGTTKITDFGLASLTSEIAVERDGLVTGTPAFLAPEIARGAPHTQASDVFALGATLYAAVEGDPPFGSVDDAAVQLDRVSRGQAPPPRKAGPLTRPIVAMLHDEPAARPTMSQVARTLTAIVKDPDQAMGPDPRAMITEAAGAPPPWRRRAVAVFAALAIGSLGVTVIVLLNEDGTANTAAPGRPLAPSERTVATPPPPPATGSALLKKTIRNYYALLAQDPAQAWAMLGPALRDQDREQFEKDWSAVEDLRISKAPTVSGNTVVVDIEYTVDSQDRVHETHQHTMVARNGTVLINTDRVLSSQVPDGAEDAPPNGENGDDEDDGYSDDGYDDGYDDGHDVDDDRTGYEYPSSDRYDWPDKGGRHSHGDPHGHGEHQGRGPKGPHSIGH